MIFLDGKDRFGIEHVNLGRCPDSYVVELLTRYVSMQAGQSVPCAAGWPGRMTRRLPRPGKRAAGSSPRTGEPGTTTRSSRPRGRDRPDR
jgi:hypothetical protein